MVQRGVLGRSFIGWVAVASLLVGIFGGGAALARTARKATHHAQRNRTVVIGYINWPEDVAVTDLWQELLQRHGYTVKLVLADVGPLYEGLSNNSVNLFFDAWLPHDHGPYWFGKANKTAKIIDHWYLSPTQEGFVVPDYVKNVNSIPQLKKDGAEFGNVIVGIEPGAGLTRLSQKAIQVYGLPETLEVSSTPAMLAELQKAEAAKKPIVVTLWSPMWVFAKWQLKYLADPKNIFGPPDNIYALANDSFAKSNPQVIHWIQRFKLSQLQLGQLEILLNANPKNPAKAVNLWIQQHKALVDGWFRG